MHEIAPARPPLAVALGLLTSRQNRATAVRRVVSLVIGLALAGCGSGSPSGQSINLTEAAGLTDTVAIEIVMLPEPDQPADAPEELIAEIGADEQVRQLIAALDTDLPLTPRALCLERYRLRFVQPDGEVVSFGYSCNGDEAFLRGDQGYWRGMDVLPPSDFEAVLSEYLQD